MGTATGARKAALVAFMRLFGGSTVPSSFNPPAEDMEAYGGSIHGRCYGLTESQTEESSIQSSPSSGRGNELRMPRTSRRVTEWRHTHHFGARLSSSCD
jgi:hypothetical protein